MSLEQKTTITNVVKLKLTMLHPLNRDGPLSQLHTGAVFHKGRLSFCESQSQYNIVQFEFIIQIYS